MLIIACGNIIADYCCITEMGAKADSWEVVNVRDENGKSTLPQKNTGGKTLIEYYLQFPMSLCKRNILIIQWTEEKCLKTW